MRLNSGFPTFKEVLGFESTHVISNYGVVVRKERTLVDALGRVRRFRARTITSCAKENGYFHAVITGEAGGQSSIHLHKMILEAFVGPRPEGMEVLHIDGDKANNQLSNLRWGTHLENCVDRSRHGSTGSVLSFEKAQEIRSLRGIKSQSQLAKEYGVSKGMISLIHRKKMWKFGPAGEVA